MAKVGLQGFWIGEYSETETNKFEFKNSKIIAKAVSLTEGHSYNTKDLYANNGKDDSVYADTDATITVVPNGFTLDELVDLVGYEEETVTYNGKEYKVKSRGNADEGKRKGVGIITTERISGKEYFIAKVYPAVSFKPPESEEFTTKGDSIDFATSQYVGKVYETLSGKQVHNKDFDTEAEAREFLNIVFGLTTTEI